MNVVERYRAADGLFVLSLPTQPGSVRDSVWRAEQFVKWFGPASEKPRPQTILVFGMGPVGMAVTVGLLESGHTLVACSKPPEPDDDSSFRSCTTRKLCPTTYDFPMSWWTARCYPAQSRECVLEWKSDTPQNAFAFMTREFRRRVEHACGDSDRLKLYDDHTLYDFGLAPPGPHRFRAMIRGERTSDSVVHDVDCVVECTGPQRHRTSLPSDPLGFVSPAFWSNDQWLFERDVRRQPRPSSVAIIGAGDGGLQDFVRLLTGIDDPFDVLERLGLGSSCVPRLVELARKMWRDFEAGNQPGLGADLDRELSGIAMKLLSGDGVTEKLEQLLRPDPERPAVQVIGDKTDFGATYFGNRLPAILLGELLARRGPRANGGFAPFRLGVRVVAVNGAGEHRCPGAGRRCVDGPHRLEFAMGHIAAPPFVNCCETSERAVQPGEFHRVLFRLGPAPFVTRLPGRRDLDAIGIQPIRLVPPMYTTSP